jgi:predicted  nucleic acid-binding Zn-ribbon protein
LVRKNRQEYDSLAKLINGKPSRNESNALLAKIKDEITELRDQQKELESKLADKRKNMYALAVLLSDLDVTMEG